MSVGKLFGGSDKKTQPVTPSASPQVNSEPAAPDAEKLRRAGRASLLIETGARGVLGNAKTGRASLLSA